MSFSLDLYSVNPDITSSGNSSMSSEILTEIPIFTSDNRAVAVHDALHDIDAEAYF